MSVPTISVVLPTFNGSRYLAKAIDSCLCQTFTNWELIIVDDASTDASPSIIAEYTAQDCRIRHLRHDTNRKLPAALNTGFSLAKGAFFTWTSDDNCLEPECLSKMLECLLAHPGYDIVYTDYAFIDENCIVTAARVAVDDPCHLVYGNSVGPNFLYRRKVHEVLSGFDESLFLVEDYDFWLRASIKFQMIALHEVLYRYRRHGQSLTAKRQEEIALAHQRAFLRSIEHMTWLNSQTRILGLIKASRLARARGDWHGANRILLIAVKTAPLTACAILFNMLLHGPDVIFRFPLGITNGGH